MRSAPARWCFSDSRMQNGSFAMSVLARAPSGSGTSWSLTSPYTMAS